MGSGGSRWLAGQGPTRQAGGQKTGCAAHQPNQLLGKAQVPADTEVLRAKLE